MKKKSIALVSAVVLGVGLTFSPVAPSTASGNVILASVDWVNSQLNPLRTKVTELETTVKRQQTEIDSLRAEVKTINDRLAAAPPAAPTNPTNPTPTPPPAEQVSRVFVSVPSATIHSGATRDYRVVATRSAGTELQVIATHTGPAGLWYRVNVTASLQGWIFSGDVSTTAAAASVPTEVITRASVHIRRGATTDYAIVATVPNATTLRYVGSHTNRRGELWYNVELSNGQRGWMLSTHATVR